MANGLGLNKRIRNGKSNLVMNFNFYSFGVQNRRQMYENSRFFQV